MRLPLLLSVLLLPTLTLCDHGGPGNGQQGQGGDGPFGQGGGSPPQNPSSPSGQGQYDSYGDQNGESSSSSSGSSSEGDDQGFGAWQSHHGRQYNSPEECVTICRMYYTCSTISLVPIPAPIPSPARLSRHCAFAPRRTAYRFGVYQSNLQIINTHNSQNNDFQLGMNRFGDLTLAEFSASMLGATPPTSVCVCM